MNLTQIFDLTDRVAVVTGGARGIGRELALGLAEMGANIVLVDLLVDEMEAVKKEIEALGRRALVCKTDVTQKSQVAEMVDKAMQEFSRLDILINCAGVCKWAPAEEMTEEDWDWVVDINLKGTFLCSQAVGREMIKRRKGKIINIASMSGSVANRPQPQCAYNASKAGVIMLTKSLAVEWAKYNINVNSISPGYINTEMTRRVSEYHEFWKTLIPLGRLGEPEELKALVLYLSSDASDFLTGHDIIIDGGYTCW